MRIEHTIKVDFQRPGVRPVVRIVEGDASTRYIVANLYNGGEPFSVGSGVTGVVKYAKSDGHSGVYDTIDKDKATEHAAVVFHDSSKQAVIELAPNISMGFGLVALIVQFVEASGTDILGTFPIDVIVERDPTDGTEAEDYFSYKALDELYAAIDEAKADAAEALAAGLHDITADYITAKVSRPTLKPDEFLLEQEDGLYRINDEDGDVPFTARVVTDRAGAVSMDVVEYRQGDRIQRTYIDSTLVTTVTMNSGDGAVEINPETLVGDLATAKSNIAALQAENVALKTRVDAQGYELENLIVAGDGKIYSKSVDSSEAYTKIVPANALPYAALDSIGGKSVVQNQLVKSDAPTVVVSGITMTNNGDGTWTASGSTGSAFASRNVNLSASRVAVSTGDMVLLRGCPPDHSTTDAYLMVTIDGSGTQITDYGGGRISQVTTGGKSNVAIIVASNISDANVTFAPELINLTQRFGAGNEPQTVEQAYAMGVPQSYQPYNPGTIVSADVQSINASGRTPEPIPQAIRNLPGYGWSAGSVYNEVDYANKQYIQRVQRVLMPELPWVPSSTGIVHTVPLSAFSQQPKSVPNTIKGNLLTSVFVTSKGDDVSGSDGTISVLNNNSIRIGTADLNTIAGQYLYYELAEPIITDISALLPDNFEVLPVEDSGTVAFHQANGTTLPVPATITFPVKIGGDA